MIKLTNLDCTLIESLTPGSYYEDICEGCSPWRCLGTLGAHRRALKNTALVPLKHYLEGLLILSQVVYVSSSGHSHIIRPLDRI